jgi:hypothetical protein
VQVVSWLPLFLATRVSERTAFQSAFLGRGP